MYCVEFDGIIFYSILKVWTGKGSMLHLIQETREHTKAVTSLTILPAAERLYSGSLDRTSRVCLKHLLQYHVNHTFFSYKIISSF